MSRIDELIQQLCPDGVEYKMLGEIAEFTYGYTAKAQDKGDARFIRITDIGNNGFLNHEDAKYITLSDESKKYLLEKGDLLVARTGATYGKTLIITSSEKSVYASFLIKIALNPNIIIHKFYWHFSRSKSYWDQAFRLVSSSSQPQFNTGALKKISIPIPPLPVQEEIVRILDKFTALEAELEAELEARRKQYEFYRDQLLTFGDEVEWKPLGEIFDTRNGYTPSTTNKQFWEQGKVPWFRMEDIRIHGRILHDSLQHISFEAVKGGRLFPANSLLVATSATIGEHALITVPHLSNQRFTSLSLKMEYIEKLNIRFLYYYCFHLDQWCKNNIIKSSFASVDMGGFKKFMFPLPTLAEQERIVAILDKFDALVNDISSGLPAELEMRRKQYEHYRDRLLTFKPLAKEA